MASHMGVQTFATERNSQVELLIHFLLENFFFGLQSEGSIKNVKIDMQKPYSSEIASDVWDHHISLTQPNNRELEIWCQTTNYKGNGTGLPEPNKTYEVRETLVEGISIRQKFKSDDTRDFRSIHFTIGDSAYTYKWFMDLKAAIFDISIYIGEKGYDIFADIDKIFKGKHTEQQKRVAFHECLKSDSQLGRILLDCIKGLNAWWNEGAHKTSDLGNQQWDIVQRTLTKINSQWRNFTQIKGGDIKGRTNSLLFLEDPAVDDPLISKTAVKLLGKKPFLSASIDVITNWNDFVTLLKGYASKADTLQAFLSSLWSIAPPQRLVIRRLLLRIHTKDSVAYIQDFNIDGITEHTIYSKDHNEAQSLMIIDRIETDLRNNGVTTINALVDIIQSNGKKLINQARWFEAKNGTELKPSFDYVETALEENGYHLVAPSKIGLSAKGYHADVSNENVRPYTNLKAVVNKSGQVLCLVKAKYFRTQEFARRCKEEAFVGLTLRNSYKNKTFTENVDLPLVMFVDMATDIVIPDHAIKRLIAFGWHPMFSVQELLTFLKEMEAKKSDKK